MGQGKVVATVKTVNRFPKELTPRRNWLKVHTGYRYHGMLLKFQANASVVTLLSVSDKEKTAAFLYYS